MFAGVLQKVRSFEPIVRSDHEPRPVLEYRNEHGSSLPSRNSSREVKYVGRQFLYDVIETTTMMTANSESLLNIRQWGSAMLVISPDSFKQKCYESNYSVIPISQMRKPRSREVEGQSNTHSK